MKQKSFAYVAFIFTVAFFAHNIAIATTEEITLQNFESDSHPCKFTVHEQLAICAGDKCLVPPAKRMRNTPIEVSLSCLPKSSPTGFENPPPIAKVQSIRSKNTPGHLSIIDDVDSISNNKKRELNFCLYNQNYNLCGYAVLSGKGPYDEQTARVKKFTEGIELLPSER